MTEVISVQFRGRGKSYYFDPAGIKASAGEQLVVETSKGLELGDCVQGNHSVEDSAVVQPLRPVVRIATADGTAYYDYSAEAVTDMLSQYLSPRVTALLKEAQ